MYSKFLLKSINMLLLIELFIRTASNKFAKDIIILVEGSKKFESKKEKQRI